MMSLACCLIAGCGSEPIKSGRCDLARVFTHQVGEYSVMMVDKNTKVVTSKMLGKDDGSENDAVDVVANADPREPAWMEWKPQKDCSWREKYILHIHPNFIEGGSYKIGEDNNINVKASSVE